MSSHTVKKIDQKEYLKKYLSGDKSKKKKKEKKRKKDIGATKVRIIDDDAIAFQSQTEIDEELLLGGEDAPQIVGEYIEERSNSATASKWRSIAVKQEQLDDNSEREIKREPVDDLWGRKAGTLRIKDEFSPPHRDKLEKRRQTTPDASPPRRRNREEQSLPQRMHSNNSDNIPPAKISSKKRRSGSYDQSPPRKHTVSKSRRSRASSDVSPPRKNRHTPERKRKEQYKNVERSPSSDQSPPRKCRRSPVNSKQRRSRSADQSPRRKSKRTAEKRGRHSSSADQSPPRQSNYAHDKNSRRNSSSDQSPVRKRIDKVAPRSRHRSPSADADQSPPRHSKRNNLSDQSPPRRRIVEHGKKRSVSPGKRRRKYSTDQSPPRRRPQNSIDRSPPRRHKPQDSPTHIKNHIKSSPPIKREKRSPDHASPRRSAKIKQARSPTPPRHSRWAKQETRHFSESPPPTHKPKANKTLDGKKAGLQDAKSLRVETEERRHREERMYNEMSKDVSGCDAEIQVRSTGRRGQRARDAAAEDPEERRRKEEREREKKEKYDRWGKGLKQVEDYRERLAADAYESSKPLARYANDEDLDKYLREQERAEDPMLEYMRKKRKEQQKTEGVTAPVKLKYEGAYPENRFGIAPSYQWDGVDRSNGYEKKWFEKHNERRALQEEAYKYSIEDM